MSDTVRAQLGAASARLAQASTSPRLDAELLLAKALEWPRSRLYSRPDEPLSLAAQQRFLELLSARAGGQPIAYLLGNQEFWSLELELGGDCLVPRPETEGLVEFALRRDEPALEVLDLGAGSGAIAIAIAHERPRWRVCAVERSSAALRWAKRNGQRHQVDVEWRQGDWFAAVPQRRFDLIVSNPPYLAANDPHLPQLQHEPRQALVAGPDGLEDLLHIIEHAPAHLRGPGLLALEHGMEQGEAVRLALHQRGFDSIQTEKDLAGLERISHGRWPVEATPG